MRQYINLLEAIERGCPPATQNIELNLKNRQKAIDEYGYGPLDPNEPNEEFWAKKGKPEQYLPGTWGPASADAMLKRDGRAWRIP